MSNSVSRDLALRLGTRDPARCAFVIVRCLVAIVGGEPTELYEVLGSTARNDGRLATPRTQKCRSLAAPLLHGACVKSRVDRVAIDLDKGVGGDVVVPRRLRNP
jgi:hypothetical protein